MPSSPPPAGTGQEEAEMVSGEASLPLHAWESGAGGDGGAPSASEGQADEQEGDAAEEDGGGSDDSDMEEDEEEGDSDYSSGSGSLQESNEERFGADTDEFDVALENLKKKVEKGHGGVKHTSPAVASCCVCMEPWASDGAHRVCCIPCGHVYGRSCLEKWLRRCGGAVAKCPQCGESFEHKRIINLHGTEYLWNDCIHDQERSQLVSDALGQLKETNKKCLEAEKRTLAIERTVVRVDREMTAFRGEVASLMVKMTNMIGDDTVTPTTPDRMLEFMSRNWPELPRSWRGLSSTLDT